MSGFVVEFVPMGGTGRATFGRAGELSELCAALTTGGARFITVTGRAGVGKTHVALDLVDELGVDAVVVPLAGVTDASLVASEIAAALDVPALPGDDPVAAIVGRIATDDRFLVLDNFEHVLEAAGVVSELIDRCPRLRIVVTSQSTLRLRRERV